METTGPEGRPRVSVRVQESDRILQSQTRFASPENGISGRTGGKSTENMTLPEQEPFLTPFPSPSSTSRLLPQAPQVFRGLS